MNWYICNQNLTLPSLIIAYHSSTGPVEKHSVRYQKHGTCTAGRGSCLVSAGSVNAMGITSLMYCAMVAGRDHQLVPVGHSTVVDNGYA